MLNFAEAIPLVVYDSFKHIFQGCFAGIQDYPVDIIICWDCLISRFCQKRRYKQLINHKTKRWDIGKTFGDTSPSDIDPMQG